MGYFSIKELGLPENSWSAFETHHHTVPFPPGKLIYLQGSPADRFYYLKSGRVKVFINSEDGSEKILTVYEAGNVFGEASFFDELPGSPPPSPSPAVRSWSSTAPPWRRRCGRTRKSC